MKTSNRCNIFWFSLAKIQPHFQSAKRVKQLGTTCTIFSCILASICYKDLPIFLTPSPISTAQKKSRRRPDRSKKMLCMPLCFSEFQILSLVKNCSYFDLCVCIYVRTGVTTIHCRCIRQTGGAKVHLQDVLLVVNLLQVSMGAVGLSL